MMEPKWSRINNNNTKSERGREGKTNKTGAGGKTGGAMDVALRRRVIMSLGQYWICGYCVYE